MTAPRLVRNILTVVLIDTVLAVVPPILLFTLHTKTTWPALSEDFLFSWIYANCIGGLAFLLIPKAWMVTCRLPLWFRWSTRITALYGVCIAGSLVAGLAFVLLRWQPASEYWPQFLGNLKFAAFLTILAGLAIGMYRTMRERLEETTLQLRTKELERERALKLATEAQLASLESRIHPHFLFNTLNSISSLIPEDPARAERLVEQMAALLRFSLDANQSGLVPIASELKIVADYLDIEHARFGDRLRYRIDVPPDLGDTRVPPLSLQTLVENSVKHAIAPDRAGGEIRISGAQSNGTFSVEVSDPGPEFQLELAPAGHGLHNLKGRLATLFGDRAMLRLQRVGGRNNLILSVPQTANGHAGISG
ncbi:MAG TPA: histidine kinase [Bryobacteraceae bacterium]|nr:histidine kinase [Bryobacteraceae bacterium]